MIPNERIDMSELMEILREAAEDEREKKRKELEERLRKINEREETDAAEWAELLKKVGERGNKDRSAEMAAFCGARRTPMRFRADAVRSITDALNRLL